MKLPLHKLIGIALVLALALSLTLVGCSEEAEVEETGLPVKLAVEPASAAVGGTVTILGSGLTTGDTIEIQICMVEDGDPVGITYSLTPVPEVNALGAFASTLSLKGYEAGVYTVLLVVDNEIVATSPIEIA